MLQSPFENSIYEFLVVDKKNELVVKSNHLIEASYRLELVEQRIILFAITEARRTQKGLNAMDFVTIKAKDYAEIYGVAPNKAYEQLKNAARTLFLREFTLYDTNPSSGKPRVTTSRWLSSTSYIDGDGEIQLQFSAVIIPYITRLEKEFTRYQLDKIADMSSPYAIRMYELLLQWGSTGKREVEIEWLKKILVLDDEYTRMQNFKARVIDVAEDQINKHSDLIVSHDQRKTGRTVSHLIFKFAPKVKPEAKPKRGSKAQPAVAVDDANGHEKAKREIARTRVYLDSITKGKKTEPAQAASPAVKPSKRGKKAAVTPEPIPTPVPASKPSPMPDYIKEQFAKMQANLTSAPPRVKSKLFPEPEPIPAIEPPRKVRSREELAAEIERLRQKMY